MDIFGILSSISNVTVLAIVRLFPQHLWQPEASNKGRSVSIHMVNWVITWPEDRSNNKYIWNFSLCLGWRKRVKEYLTGDSLLFLGWGFILELSSSKSEQEKEFFVIDVGQHFNYQLLLKLILRFRLFSFLRCKWCTGGSGNTCKKRVIEKAQLLSINKIGIWHRLDYLITCVHSEFDVSNRRTCSVWLDTFEFNNIRLRDYLAKKAFLFGLYYSFHAYFSVFNSKLMLKNTGPNLDHSSIFSHKIDYKTMRYVE